MTAEQLPELREEISADLVAGGAEWIAHGISINGPLYDGMKEAVELACIIETRRCLAGCGIAARGW